MYWQDTSITFSVSLSPSITLPWEPWEREVSLCCWKNWQKNVVVNHYLDSYTLNTANLSFSIDYTWDGQHLYRFCQMDVLLMQDIPNKPTQLLLWKGQFEHNGNSHMVYWSDNLAFFESRHSFSDYDWLGCFHFCIGFIWPSNINKYCFVMAWNDPCFPAIEMCPWLMDFKVSIGKWSWLGDQTDGMPQPHSWGCGQEW